jgi:hypothetical protein
VAEGRIAEARGAYDQALEEYETRARLFERNPDAIPERDVEKAKTLAEARKGALYAAVATKTSTEAEVNRLLPAHGSRRATRLRVSFDRRIEPESPGARITSDGGLLAYRELDDAFGLTTVAASTLTEGRRGKNIRHHLLGLLRQAIYAHSRGEPRDALVARRY